MMNINVLVSREDNLEWLRYVLDSFILVSGANFRFKICDQTQYVNGDNNIVITYGIGNNIDNGKVISIPRINDYQPGDYSYIVADDLQDNRIKDSLIPVFQKTFAPKYHLDSGKPLLRGKEDGSCCAALVNNGIRFSFDLFYNCFVHLSRLEEWEYEDKFGPTHSYISKLKGTKIIYHKPIVNYFFAILEDTFTLLADKPYKDKLFRKQQGFQVCLTHDVDYIKKTLSLKVKRFAFYLFNGFRDLKRAKLHRVLKGMYRSLSFLLRPSNYWQFEYIQQLEEAYNFKSTFFFYTGVPGNRMTERFREFIFDPGYNIEKSEKLQKKVKELIEKGWEVALHGSFDSYNSPELLLKEKKRLEAITDSPVLSTRQHWLRLSLRNTWRLQTEAGIKADTTLGFNEWVGFRAGIASPFYPYDFNKDERHQILEVPLVLMDGSIFDYCQMDSNEAREKSFEILEEVKKFSGCVAINWHQRTSAADYKWYWLYQEILNWIKENGGEGMPILRCFGVTH